MRLSELKLNDALASFEKGLNLAGYIPVVSMISGTLRSTYGKTLIITGVAGGALLAIVALFDRNAVGRQKGLEKAMKFLVTCSVHGIANIGRSRIERVPFLSLVTCLPYDLLGIRFVYPKETPGRWEYVTETRPTPQGG
jgi:hypothetical protein